jgi:hypothetical protein
MQITYGGVLEGLSLDLYDVAYPHDSAGFQSPTSVKVTLMMDPKTGKPILLGNVGANGGRYLKKVCNKDPLEWLISVANSNALAYSFHEGGHLPAVKVGMNQE